MPDSELEEENNRSGVVEVGGRPFDESLGG